MNLAGSCSPKDVESQLLSPGKTTWQKPHAICWKNPYVLEMVQTYRRWVNPCLQGDRCSRGSRLQHSCFLSKIISFSFFLLPLGEADGQGWHYCSSRCPYWALMVSPGASEEQPQRGEKQKAKKKIPSSLLLQCWGWASCAGNGSGLPIGIIYNLQMTLKSALLIFA